VAFPGGPPASESRARRYLRAQPALLAKATRVRPDVVHATGSEASVGWTLRRQVVTVHDVYPWATVDADTDPRLRAYLAWQRRRLRRVAAVIAVSQAVATDVASVLGIAEDRIHVVPEGVSTAFSITASPQDEEMRQRAGITGPGYVLWVGSLRAHDPRKGLDGLLNALAGSSAQLVLVGDLGEESKRVTQVAAASGVRATTTGRIADEDLAALYRGAGVVAVSSRDEGFGLPVLEALASGAPVVATAVGNLPDLAGDAAVLVPPDDPKALAAGIESVLGGKRLAAKLSKLGPERAAGFSWTAAARRTADVYRVVANPS
jgi:glycosyltransferase involved in cell wall biosynthesis